MPGNLDKYLNPKPEKDEKGFPLVQMVLFRFKTENCLALSYPHLLWADYNPSYGITLHFSTHTVKLVGVRLASLMRELVTFSVAEITESSERYDDADHEIPRVTEIIAKEVHEDLDLSELADGLTP
jgi:hypothetical protein